MPFTCFLNIFLGSSYFRLRTSLAQKRLELANVHVKTPYLCIGYESHGLNSLDQIKKYTCTKYSISATLGTLNFSVKKVKILMQVKELRYGQSTLKSSSSISVVYNHKLFIIGFCYHCGVSFYMTSIITGLKAILYKFLCI